MTYMQLLKLLSYADIEGFACVFAEDNKIITDFMTIIYTLSVSESADFCCKLESITGGSPTSSDG